MPFLLSYTSDKIKEANTLEKDFIKLLTDYLLTKQLISTNSNDLFLSIKTPSSIENNVDCEIDESIVKLSKSKKLFQFFCISQDRQHLNSDLKLFLVKYMKQELNETASFDAESIINILILVPFILNYNEKMEDKYQIIELVETLLKSLLDKNDTLNELNYFIISIAIWSLLLMQKPGCFNSRIDTYLEKAIDLFISLSRDKNEIEKNKCLIHILRSLDYLFGYKFSVNKKSIEKNEKINTTVTFMKYQLSSPYHESRLISLNILTKLLHKEAESKSTEDNEKSDNEENVLTLCIQAENIKSTIEDYRQKLYYMQRLDFDTSQRLMPSSDYEDVRGDNLKNFKTMLSSHCFHFTFRCQFDIF